VKISWTLPLNAAITVLVLLFSVAACLKHSWLGTAIPRPFSVLGFGVEEFLIPGSQLDYGICRYIKLMREKNHRNRGIPGLRCLLMMKSVFVWAMSLSSTKHSSCRLSRVLSSCRAVYSFVIIINSLLTSLQRRSMHTISYSCNEATEWFCVLLWPCT